MLNSNDLTWMRADVALLLPDVGTISTKSVSSDGSGGVNSNYAPRVGGTVACRIDPIGLGNRQIVVAEREGFVIEYVATVPYTATINADDLFDVNGQSYSVVGLDTEQSWRVCKRVFLGRVS